MNDLVQIVLAAIIPVILAITWATAAEAYAAHHFGDNTGRMMGRLTLNPFVHLNVLGTVVVPAAVFLLSQGMVLFGWGKPVPVNYGHMRNPKRDMVWVSLAGPLCNLAQLLVWGLVLKLLFLLGVQEKFVLEVCKFGVIINAVMFAFTMLPILPLNGGRVVLGLLPPRQAMVYAKHERWGLLIVLGLLISGLLMNYWVIPVASMATSLLKLI